MIRLFLLFSLNLLFLSLSALPIHAEIPIPKTIEPILKKSPDNLKNHVLANAKHGTISYYLISEITEDDFFQVLIQQQDKNTPKLLARKKTVFPLSQFIDNKQVIKKIAHSYVQTMINHCKDGIEPIQNAINYNPERFAPKAPELIKAYEDAGIRIPPISNH
jgi:hypothetical protein